MGGKSKCKSTRTSRPYSFRSETQTFPDQTHFGNHSVRKHPLSPNQTQRQAQKAKQQDIQRSRLPTRQNQARKAGMQKRMGCKADGEAKYRSNLLVVRILARHPTQSDRLFCAPPYRYFSYSGMASPDNTALTSESFLGQISKASGVSTTT